MKGNTPKDGDEQFLDLTPEGLERTQELASTRIIDWMRRNDTKRQLRIFSSPAGRARDTALVIKREILHFGDIAIEEDIRPMDMYDRDRCMELIRSLKGYIRWETEPAFSDLTLFESCDFVCMRLLCHLTKFICEA
jgi:broad specificity phosphatase PhoE